MCKEPTKNPIISVVEPGMINSNAAKAIEVHGIAHKLEFYSDTNWLFQILRFGHLVFLQKIPINAVRKINPIVLKALFFPNFDQKKKFQEQAIL